LVCDRAVGWRRLLDLIRSRDDVDSATSRILSELVEICEHTLPRCKSRNYSAPWWTPELTQLMKRAKRWKKFYRRVSLRLKEQCFPLMKKAQEDFDKAVKRAKQVSWRSFVSRQDRESVWSQV